LDATWKVVLRVPDGYMQNAESMFIHKKNFNHHSTVSF